MATVHLGRLVGTAGFSRIVAIKRLHPYLGRDADFVRMFMDKARLAARLHHPNVVATLDVVTERDELFLVMEYVRGSSVAGLLKALRGRGERVSPAIAAAVLVGALHGLHAAHDATSETGTALGLVHRDVSPQNVLVGSDGIARVLDFGVAKAAGRHQATEDGQVKGKAGYMSPEQVRGEPLDRRSDIFAAGIVLWELLTGVRLFAGDNIAATSIQTMYAPVRPPSTVATTIPAALDEVVLKALERDRENRYASADEMARAIEAVIRPASASEVGALVSKLAEASLLQQADLISRIERGTAAETTAPLPARASQVSDDTHDHDTGISLVSNASRARRTSLSRGLAIVLLFVALALVWFGARRIGEETQAGPHISSAAAPPSAEAALLPSSPDSANSVAPSPTLPVPSAPASSEPLSRAPRARPTAHPSSPSQAAAPRAAQCQPPYTVDSDGIRRPKRECFLKP